MARSDSVGKSQQPQPPQRHVTQTKPTTANLRIVFSRALQGMKRPAKSLRGRVRLKIPASSVATEQKLATLSGLLK